MSSTRTRWPGANRRTGGPSRLGERLGSRDNNFDLLRLLAAWAVLVSHSFALVGEPEPLHQMNTTLGNLGVLIFFGVSGLLITRSWQRDPSPRDFWTKRALRLLPALAVVATVTAFVIGPIFTSNPLSQYFLSAETWTYPFRIVGMFPFGAGLPGVFNDNLYGGTVNGPLWSLPVEVFAYAMIAVMGLIGLLRNNTVVTVVTVLALAWAAVWASYMPPAVGAIYVLAAFAVGAAAHAHRDRIPLSWGVAVGLLVLCVVSGFGPTSVRVVTWSVAVPYLCYWFALAVPAIRSPLTRWGDASYGMYIWAFPVQQGIVSTLGDISPWAVIALATPIVYLLAQLSWHLVEGPALRRKPRPSVATQ